MRGRIYKEGRRQTWSRGLREAMVTVTTATATTTAISNFGVILGFAFWLILRICSPILYHSDGSY